MSLGQVSNSPYTLAVKGLSMVVGGHQVLDISSLEIARHKVMAVIGPNGSGKTTMLLSLALLLKPSVGTIYYNGNPVSNGKEKLELRRRFAVVFQEPLLLNGSVWSNVTLGLRLRGIEKSKIKKRAGHWLERFGVADLAGRQARTLSAGESKRVSLARAFALEPEILFLDEPFTALDTPTHQRLIDDFGRVLHETRVSTLFVTHDHNEALVLADRIVIIMGGRIRQTGTPQDVFALPADEEVAEFIKAGNILHGIIAANNEGLALVEVGKQHLEVVSSLPAGTHVTIYLPYEDIVISIPSEKPALSSARNHLRGRVSRILPLGAQVRVTVDSPLPLIGLITRRSCEELGLDLGSEVVISFKAAAVHLLKRE